MIYDEVYISFKLSREANQLLSESADRSGRTKKVEAKLRLESNLQRVDSISHMGSFILRAENEDKATRGFKDVGCIKQGG